ncbi:MAG: hypothetical protein ABIK92_19870 [Pseudomonadota bacterium]
MNKNRKAVSDVQLSEEMPKIDQLPKGSDYFDFTGMMVMGESQGNELCLVLIVWRVGGGKKGKWMVDEAPILQTSFMMQPHDKWGKLEETVCIGNRQDPREWEGTDFHLIEETDKVTWKVGNREFINRPPYWEYKGEHMGVECNLTLGGLGNATRIYGAWDDLPKKMSGGFEQHCWVEGSITVEGKEYVLENGYGIHDRIVFGEQWDHQKNMAVPYSYLWGMNDDLQIYLWDHPGIGMRFCRVFIEDKEITFTQADISLNELEWFVDHSMTGMRVPIRWHASMSSAAGVLDIDFTAGARGIYCVNTAGGTTLRYTYILHTNGRFMFPDGRCVQIKNMRTYKEWGRSTMPLPSGAL